MSEETGGLIPVPGPDATLEELNDVYRRVEASDMSEFLKQRILFELADRIRDYGKPVNKPEVAGVAFNGADLETVVKSGYKGGIQDPDTGNIVKVRPSGPTVRP